MASPMRPKPSGILGDHPIALQDAPVLGVFDKGFVIEHGIEHAVHLGNGQADALMLLVGMFSATIRSTWAWG